MTQEDVLNVIREGKFKQLSWAPIKTQTLDGIAATCGDHQIIFHPWTVGAIMYVWQGDLPEDPTKPTREDGHRYFFGGWFKTEVYQDILKELKEQP